MLRNVRYDKIKIVHKLSCLLWFLEKHGIEDAKTASDDATVKLMEELKKDLHKHLDAFDSPCCAKCNGDSCSSCK